MNNGSGRGASLPALRKAAERCASCSNDIKITKNQQDLFDDNYNRKI
jgi:hypothetical protein